MSEIEKKKQNRTKQTRSPDGTIRSFKEKRTVDHWGKKKTVEVWEARKRYRCERCEKCAASPRHYHEKKKRAYSHAEALAALHNLRIEIADELQRLKEASERDAPERERKFFELCDYFETHYVKPAVFVGNRQVGGYRQNLKTIRAYIEEFRAFFGDVPVKKISYEDLSRYTEYLSTQTRKPKNNQITPEAGTLSVRSINDRLTFLRRVFSVGVQKEWLFVNPFKKGAALICRDAENRRTRLLSREEEARLIAHCTGKRAHLVPIIYLTIDTTLRSKEIFRLRWTPDKDGLNYVDLDNRVIYAVNSKTRIARPKLVPITNRVYNALQEIKSEQERAGLDSPLVFEVHEIKRAFNAAVKDAGLADLQFRDLRKTGGARMREAGLSDAEVMTVMGHTQERTYQTHYVVVDEAAAKRIGERMDNRPKTEPTLELDTKDKAA